MDPEQVRRFADELKRFNTDLQDRIVSLQARFTALGDTWQDQEHAKFAEEFKQTMKAMKKFIEVSNQHTPYLLRKAQRIDPECAMCFWGEALVLGPNINLPMQEEAVPLALAAMEKAKSAAAKARPNEQVLIPSVICR